MRKLPIGIQSFIWTSRLRIGFIAEISVISTL